MRRSRFRFYMVAPALFTAACSSASSTASPGPEHPPAAETPSGGERTTRESPGGVQLVRAREAPSMPECRADDPIALAALSEGIPAHAAIAWNAHGGLIAFLSDDNHDGVADLMVQSVDAHGARQGAPTRVSTGAHPAFPALSADGEGFLLAYREDSGGSQRVVARPIAANGTPAGVSATLALGPAWYGPPGVIAGASGRALAVVRSSARGGDGESVEIASEHGSPRVVTLPDAGRWDESRAPQLITDGDSVRVFALATLRDAAPDAERALMELGDPVRLVSRDVDTPAVLSSPSGALLAWRARLAPEESGTRAFTIARDGHAPSPPITLNAYRGAFDLPVALAPVGPHLVAALTLSQMSDRDGASLDASLLTDEGAYIGRRMNVASAPVRGASLATAGDPAGGAWVVLEQRDDHGGAALSLTRVTCDPTRAMNPLDVPPATVPQEPAGASAAPASLAASPPGANACTSPRPVAIVARHTSGVDDASAGTSAAVVSLARTSVTFAVVREGGNTHVAVNTVDENGAAGTAQNVLDGAVQLLAAGSVGDEAVAVITAGPGGRTLSRVSSRGDGHPPTVTPVGVSAASSAVIAPEASALFVVGGSESDPTSSTLYLVSLRAARRATAPVAIAALLPGDRVLDAIHTAGGTTVLLARSDRLGASVSAAYARLIVPDRAADVARLITRVDPFAAPIAYGGGDAVLLPGASPVFVRNARGTLRAGTLATAGLDAMHPMLEALPRGGGILARSRTPRATPWLLITSGIPAEEAPHASPFTLVAVGAQGQALAAAPAAVASSPDEPGPVEGFASVSASPSGDRVAVLYRRTETDGSLAWVLWQASCVATATTTTGGH